MRSHLWVTCLMTACMAFGASSVFAAPVDPANAGDPVGGALEALPTPPASAEPSPLKLPPAIVGEPLLIQPDPPGSATVLPPLVASVAGCGLVAAPLGTCGTVSGIAGVGSVIAVLGAGALPQCAIPLFFASFCFGLPSFCLMGPASVGAAAGGAMIATRTYNDRSGVPALVAMIPPLVLALAGSMIATFGLFYSGAAFLALSQGQGRAGLAMLGVGLLTSLLAGPLAAFMAVGADVAFGGPYSAEEGSAAAPAVRSPVGTGKRGLVRPRVSMAY